MINRLFNRLSVASIGLVGLFAGMVPEKAFAGCVLDERLTIDHGHGAIVVGYLDIEGTRFVAAVSERDKRGALGGSINGREVSFRIRWSHGPIGNYSGYISSTGRVSGTNYDERNPRHQTNWSIRQKARCS